MIRKKSNNRSREADGSPNPTDIVVGQRLRQRRLMLGKSQQQVAEAVGLTFQQVQKYERGTNRIGASRLYDFAQVLDVTVGYFFEGAAADTKAHIQGFAEESTAFDYNTTADKREALELLRVYNGIEDKAMRKQVMSLVRSVSSTPKTGAKRGRKPGSTLKKKAVKKAVRAKK